MTVAAGAVAAMELWKMDVVGRVQFVIEGLQLIFASDTFHP